MKVGRMNVHPDELAYELEDPADVTLLRLQRGGYALALQVVPLEKVVLHEHYHTQRMVALSARLVEESRLINPLVVAQQGEQYVVLDGATRLTAFRHLGYPHIIVQVVNLEEQQVQLTSWYHVVYTEGYGGGSAELLALLRGISGLRLVPSGNRAVDRTELPPGALGHLVTAERESFVLEVHDPSCFSTDHQHEPEAQDAWLDVLNQVVDAYGQWGNVERTLSTDIDALAAQFPNFAALFVFPQFTPQTIMKLASQGRTVPAGITRFVIPGRILRLNAPLDKLVADEPLAAKQAWLDELIRQKLLNRQVRFYEEPVMLLDE